MEFKTVTVGVPIGVRPPSIGNPMIVDGWEVDSKVETILKVSSIDNIEWKIYDDIKELMVTVTGEIINIQPSMWCDKCKCWTKAYDYIGKHSCGKEVTTSSIDSGFPDLGYEGEASQ